MQDKIIIITGAGFSAPANIPIQNRILDEMTKQEANILDVSQSNIELDNKKFLDAFARVGLYLLTKYSNIPDDVAIKEFSGVTNEDLYRSYILAQKIPDCISFLNVLLSEAELYQDGEKAVIKDFLFNNGPAFDNYFTELTYIKGEIKRRLKFCKVNVSLEDVFTAFDKAISQKTHTRNFTYHEEDYVRQSILRLFVYYFGKILSTHKFNTNEYLSFIRFMEQNRKSVSLITTNWDTLIEGYLSRNRIEYELCLNSIYYKYDYSRKNPSSRKKIAPVKLVKLHGSINWFKCLQCDCMSIIEKNPCGEYLLTAEKKEVCINCGEQARDDSVLLQPEITTPTMLKSFDNQLYKNLWTSAAEELRKARKIVFIGYSMPIADFELKYMLQNNIQPSCEIDVVLHRNDNPKQLTQMQGHLKDLLPEKRYRDAFVKNPIHFSYEGFGSYFINQTNTVK